jgi:hypothetical protein
MHDTMNAADGVSAGMVSRPDFGDLLKAVGVYHVEHCVAMASGDLVRRSIARTLVTTEGKNAMLDKFLGLGTAYAAIAMGLHTTVGSATSTYATPIAAGRERRLFQRHARRSRVLGGICRVQGDERGGCLQHQRHGHHHGRVHGAGRCRRDDQVRHGCDGHPALVGFVRRVPVGHLGRHAERDIFSSL